MTTQPRKHPTQARARLTVEAIVLATAELLARDGLDALTTAKVAERAGVSIGSLYQYFPNKQALAAAVVDHFSADFAARFAASTSARGRGTLADCVDGLIAFALASHGFEPELHRAINMVAPRVERGDQIAEVSAQVARMIEDELTHHRAQIAPDLDLAEAAALIETLLETMVHRAVDRHPVRLGPSGLAQQCRRAIFAYLTAGQPGTAP